MCVMTIPSAATCRVLVVDDDPGICALLRMSIDLDPRFELAAQATTAHEARELVREADFDIALIDMTLPDGDGIELLADLHELRPDARLVLFTGWDDERTLDRAIEMGAAAVFRKDVSPPLLLDQLHCLGASAA